MSDTQIFGSVTVEVDELLATVTLDRPPVNAVDPAALISSSGPSTR